MYGEWDENKAVIAWPAATASRIGLMRQALVNRQVFVRFCDRAETSLHAS
jgi:hypothetical protein